MPKALVRVGGKPLLEHAILKLKGAGVDEIIINVHHFADQVISFIQQNESFGIRIEFSDERKELLDTGGGIKKAAWFFNDGKPFLVYNVDILSNIDLRKLCTKSATKHSIATLVCSERETSRYLLFDQANLLNGWINEKTGKVKSPYRDFNPRLYKKLAFAGIHLMDPAIFQLMVDFPDCFSIIDFYLSVCDKANIIGYTPENFTLLDVGKTDSLKEAERFLYEL